MDPTLWKLEKPGVRANDLIRRDCDISFPVAWCKAGFNVRANDLIRRDCDQPRPIVLRHKHLVSPSK